MMDGAGGGSSADKHSEEDIQDPGRSPLTDS